MTDESDTGAPVAPPAAPPAPPPGLDERIAAAVAAWLAEHIHNSPVARATDAYNHLVSVLPALRESVLAAIQDVA